MSNTEHTDSRPTWPGRTSSPSRNSWAPVVADTAAQSVVRVDVPRRAMPSPPPRDARPAQAAATMPSNRSHEIVDQLEVFVHRIGSMKDGADSDKQSIFDSVKRFARSMQHKVAKLGGIAPRTAAPLEGSLDRLSRPSVHGDRPSFSNSLDGYRPEIDVVAPISVRPNGMELLWVCGDCGEHYPRQQQAPESCDACGAPRQNFYAPIED